MTKKLELTEQEQLFVDHYSTNQNIRAAVKAAGFKTDNPSQYGGRILMRPNIQAALKTRMVAKTASLIVSETDVIEGLLAEARNAGPGSTQMGRITAWVNIGKHLGMFENKKKENSGGSSGTTINVINFSNGEQPPPRIAKVIEGAQEAIEALPADKVKQVLEDDE